MKTYMVIARIFLLCLALIVLVSGCGQVSVSETQPATSVSSSQAVVIEQTPEPSAATSVSPTPIQTTPPDIPPKYIFYLIGDGMGMAQRQTAERYLQYISGSPDAKLVMDQLDTSAFYTTYSLNAEITDSAAAGTALACGVKTNNGCIAETPDGEQLTTILEAVQNIGYATGIVTSARLTDATPASFAAHVSYRGNESGIALQYPDSHIDFFAGGGLEYFLPAGYETDQTDPTGTDVYSARDDSRDLIQDFSDNEYIVFSGEQGALDFPDYTPEAGDRVFASFTINDMPYELDRDHADMNLESLSDIAQTAVDLLSLDPDGFLLMVEGARIDDACHRNDLAASVHETLAFDAVVKLALDFYNAHPEETLIIVASDHETGGLRIKSGGTLNMGAIDPITMSFQGTYPYLYQPGGNRGAYFDFLETIGIDHLTDKETALIEAGMDVVDSGEFASGFNRAGIAVNDVIAERAGIQWTTFEHTAALIPLSIYGAGQDSFTGLRDNTQIAQTLANILGVDIG